jgi:hypothetical protein
MVDGLADLSAPVDDQILVLNILRGLNQRFEHVGSIIQHYSPFSNFLKVQDNLLLKELYMDSTRPSSQTTAPTSSDGRTNAPWPTYGHPW